MSDETLLLYTEFQSQIARRLFDAVPYREQDSAPQLHNNLSNEGKRRIWCNMEGVESQKAPKRLRGSQDENWIATQRAIA
ncbi:hypothetical protein PRIPAC_74549 [Pristionchus pacificus]|uniref:Uncharacterized protein n=1 Tax=Pristionchus pacificus TaxID=54126 RepID=A0A2A6C7H6_PRIPA|nr:hypothetical protein PRIPAC_74549 [Pristionchus pacificus]|eukprot:PDM74028.1 hypothetical protein PRIPAC_41384 [Pristionchus pacificus]